MNETSYTHKALAALLGVSETTVKSYRRKFPGCIPVTSRGKPIRFPAEAAAVTTRIRDLFETGMSVEEVRSRLAAEFSWISPEAPKPASQSALPKAELAPEISTGVSNMAKSMVAMSQQQKILLERMRGIEQQLEGFGQEGTPEEQRGNLLAAAQDRNALLEERLNRLDATTQELAEGIGSLAAQLEQFIGRRDKAAEEWKKDVAAATFATAAKIVEEAAHKPQTAKVIPLRPETPPPTGLSEPVARTSELPDEPPRAFFSLPLCVRSEQGHYVSVGGRGRGRFSINDLKAMLIYGNSPPNHFTLHWEQHGQGWWLHLEQRATERSFQLLLMELPTQKSGNVVEILKLKRNEETLHPAEILSIIDSLGG